MPIGQLDEGLLQYEIKDFSLGLINSLTDLNIPAGAGDIVQNARFDSLKGISKRLNRARYNDTSLGTKPVMAVERIYVNSNRYFLCVYDTNLKVGSDSLGTFTNLATVTPNLRYNGVTYKNFHYLFNGVDANMKTAGTVTNHISNGDFENWSAGTSVAPDGWTADLNGGSVARESSIVKLGSYSVKLTSPQNNDAGLVYDIGQVKGMAYWRGRSVTVGIWIKSSNLGADNGFIVTSDLLRIYLTPYITADEWTFISATWKVESDATNLKLCIHAVYGYGVAYFDGAMCVEGESVSDYEDNSNGASDIMGCKVMVTAPTGAKNGTGVLAVGTYKYYFTWEYDGYQEASRGGYLAVAVDASDSIDLHTFEIAPANVTHMRIYRTTVGGATYYYHSRHTKAQVLGYTSGVPYNDNTADSALDTTIQAPTDNGVPPICKFGILHKDRIFTAGNPADKNCLYYSKIASVTSYPDIFPSTNYIYVAKDDGDEITGLAHDPTGALCVFKRNSIRRIFTDGDPTNWAVSEPYSYDGCIAPYSIAESSYGIIFLSKKGETGKQLNLFDGQNTKPLSNKVSVEADKILNIKLTDCEGHFQDDKYYLTFTNGENGVSYNDTQLIYDFRTDSFSTDTKHINCFCRWYGAGDRDELYTGDSTEGFMYREDADEKTYDIVHKLKSELDAGTLSQVATGGTETNPTLALTSAISADVGAQIVSSLTTGPLSAYKTEEDTVYPSGWLKSPVIAINATALAQLLWNESLGTTGDVNFWLRTGVNSATVSAADWSGPFTEPDGSEITAVSADAYIQYKVKLYTNNASTIAVPNLYLEDGYVVKIYAGGGAPVESAIEFNFRSGELDLGYPRQIKRFRGIRIEYTSESLGNLYCYYSLDRGTEASTFVKNGTEETYINLATYPTIYTANFPNSVAELIRLRFYSNDANNITIKRVVLLFTVKPPRW